LINDIDYVGKLACGWKFKLPQILEDIMYMIGLFDLKTVHQQQLLRGFPYYQLLQNFGYLQDADIR